MLPNKETIFSELSGYSITTGEVLGSDYLILAVTSEARLRADPEDHHSYFFIFFVNDVGNLESDFPVTSMAALPIYNEVISISAGGSVRRSSPPPRGGMNEMMVGDFSGKKVYGRTRLTEVASVDGVAYAVGSRCAVYRRKDADEWECIDENCYKADNFQRSFNAIDGFGRQEIYAVGELGEIWCYDGSKWHAIVSPTSCSLNTVVCAPDGYVYASGANGTIVRGRGDQWQIVENIPKGLEFWGSAYFEGELYLTANTRSVHKLTAKAGLISPSFGSCRVPLTAYHLKVRDSRLWLFGSKDVRCFSSGTWEEIATLT